MIRSVSGHWMAMIASASQILALASCGRPPQIVASPPFPEVFELVEVIELGEDPADSIAEIGVFVERQDGGFIIGDWRLPRVRTYTDDGSLKGAFGRFGDGPWELQRISSVAETASGQIVVSSPRNRWLTYLNSDLSPDTLVGIGANAVLQMFPFGPDIVFYGIGPAGTIHDVAMQDGYFHRLVDGSVAWTSWTTPIFGMPYWHGFGDVTGAVAGDSIFAMAKLLYPATILNGAGDSVGAIGTPSPSFRRIPEIEFGAYATTSPRGQDASDVLGTFDLVSRIDVVAGSHLVFTLGQHDETKPFYPFRVLHTRLEVYDRHTGTKLYDDVLLSGGVKVLGGGRYLYVLQNPDIPPWRIAKYRLRVAD
ncbi:MAG: hypothetical protein F4Z31_16305 [Gemmatimonadetes bacterium]|nr:hypothetical protein [Gemmatimonadota bacterium]MYJ11903.1 hypothetical protein [Gemmatimonadota bacterium]